VKSTAPDDQFVLTSEGTIRWTGDAVGRLTAADDALHPRVRIISDERLSGAPRDAVQTRLDLWLKTHIEKLLGPLFELSKAEDVTGIARGIAFQLVEAMGVLERAKIAAEMKDLDQPSRAVLRKYGVRFGAYHIYVPPLLKPAARALASLLWALKEANVDLSTLSGAQHLASSGRTSFPIDKTLPRDAYRVLGYRQCGERAVRVDILERLADLIRPALSWRETSPGEKPAGAFDGRSFVVTQAMTSLTGSAGEDFASILRALGYRMERRPQLAPKPVVVEAAAEAAPAETASEAPSEAVSSEVVAEPDAEAVSEAASSADAVPTPEAAPAPVVAEVAAASSTLLPAIDFAQGADASEAASENATNAGEPASETPETAEAIASEALASETLASEAAAPSVAAETPVEASSEASPEAASASAVSPTETAAAPAGPELVEVWRPGGRSEERRPQRHDRNRHRRPDRAAEGTQPAAAGEAGASEPGDGAKRDRHRHGRRDRHRDFQKLRPGQPAADGAVAAATAADGAPAPQARDGEHGRPPRDHRADGKGHGGDRNGGDRNKGKSREDGGRDKGRDKGRGDRGGRDRDRGGRESGPSHRQYASTASPRERDRPIDPNSPFAKLAALKEQMSASRKDP
jgi:ATP-dependent RNA helicase SUPV3L1/SUV3